MNDAGRKFASVALAGAVMAGVPTATAHAESLATPNVTPEVGVVETKKEVLDYDYIVKEGDTFESLSNTFFEEPNHAEAIAKYNNMEVNTPLQPGSTIKIAKTLKILYGPTFTGTNKEARIVQMVYPEDEVYVVKAGDSLSKIIKNRYGKYTQDKIEKLAFYNNIENPDLIFEGQEIKIPCEEKLQHIELPQSNLTYDYDSNEVVINEGQSLRLN